MENSYLILKWSIWKLPIATEPMITPSTVPKAISPTISKNIGMALEYENFSLRLYLP